MTISATITTFIVSFLLPAVVSLLTKSAASTWVKQFVSALLAAATGVIVAATTVDGSASVRGPAVLLALGAFIASQAAYTGLYAPHNANAKILPTVGIG